MGIRTCSTSRTWPFSCPVTTRRPRSPAWSRTSPRICRALESSSATTTPPTERPSRPRGRAGPVPTGRAAGALVITERRRGKGYAVRRLVSDVDADFFVMVDGDGTYDAARAPEMVRIMRDEGVDTVLGVRQSKTETGAAEFRAGHQLGNLAFSRIFSVLFDTEYRDALTGYRGLSRRFVKSSPLLARGFDVEIELNAPGASLGMPLAEVTTLYVERPTGSASKLNTYRDGLRILRRLMRLFRDFRPSLSFGGLGAVLGLLGVVAGVPVVLEYERTGLVPRFPTLFVVVALLLAALFLL